MSRDDEFRDRLAAHLAGALPPAERRAVEEHLDGCASCRMELAELSKVLPLLARVTPADLVGDALPPEGLRISSLRAVGAARRRERRRARWVAAAGTVAGAAASAVLAIALLSPGGDGRPLRLTAERGYAVTGIVHAAGRPWGTQISLDIARLPAARSYTLWAVGTDGRRWPAATWAPTATHAAHLVGAAPVPLARLARLVIRDQGGDELATARAAAVR